MAYFQNFETLAYDVVGDDNPKLFTHILRRVKINDLVKDNILLFDFYQVKPGEKPEDIAFDFYGSAELHWLVLYANNIVDRYHQWPMSVRGFEEYLKDKYTNPLATHHFEISQKSGDTNITINIGLDSTGHSKKRICKSN
jgi:hypothetical protein